MLIRVLAMVLAVGYTVPAFAAPIVDFNRDIRPILSNHCYACHGPDEGQRKAGLRLDRKEDAFRALKSGLRPVVAGNLAESELFHRVISHDDDVMPPAKFGKPLSAGQVDLLKRWIEQGAKWQGHWAYTPPIRPTPPTGFPGASPIDAFIHQGLQPLSLQPSPTADRATLIRRLSFDLIGLPPTLAEVDAFVNDPAPDAYEKVVDRLLRSPRFGERWAIHWLDLARYADTNGYHIDNHRDMWKWREWVIDAFNTNKPFDQFTIEQLAGDMLPNATIEQKVASGFHRNVMVNFEGGADPNEYMTKYIVDRVNTTATVWMGTTIGCAECHDHKYDPFTQRDFYRMYAFFNNIPEQGLDGRKDNPVPFIRVETAEQKARLAAIDAQLRELDQRIAQVSAGITIDESAAPAASNERRDFVWVDDAIPTGAKVEGPEWKFVTAPVHSGKLSAHRAANGLSQHLFTSPTQPLTIGAGDRFFVHVYLDPKNPPQEVMIQFFDGGWEHRAYWGDNRIDWGVANSPSRKHMGPLPEVGKWVRLEVAAADVGFAVGAKVQGWAFTQFDGSVYWDTAGLHTRTPQGDGSFDTFAEWVAFARSAGNNLPADVKAAVKLEAAKRSPAQQQRLRDYFVQNAHRASKPIFAPLVAEKQRLAQEQTTIRQSSPQVSVMEEMPNRRDTFMLVRGDWQLKGEKVTPGTPASLPALPANSTADRLALARWLVNRDHPLTARVTVNRFWEQLFGVGIVKTSDDFGSQGEWPSHPELLDWLAVEFMDSGWDMKALLKTMVMSTTYRQSTKITADMLHRDPENRFLARGARFRLPAEMIRDQALQVSGLLDGRIGGPSVRPYQPSGLWEAIAFGGGFSSQSYEPSKGADLYRRGVYVYWKRSLPHPALTTFDAPNREVCAERRPRTNTPLQALVLMNDPIFVEAARNLAVRVMREGGDNHSAQAQFLFRTVLGRPARPEEEGIIIRMLQQQLGRFSTQSDNARKLLSIGESPRPDGMDLAELAAWTMVCNAVLSLDETITKG